MEENNKLIAEFMGWFLLNEYPYRWAYKKGEQIIVTSWKLAPRFNSSWDLIMPVLDRFSEIWAKNKYESLSRDTDKLAQNIGKALSIRNIKKVNSAVVEFIKWYNKQKK